VPNRQGIKTKNLDQYIKLHQQRKGSKRPYGTTSERRYAFIKPIVEQLKPKAILDYGCGSSTVVQKFAKTAKVFRFDPAVPEISEVPEEFLEFPEDERLVICTHVLEHVEPEELQTVLEDIKALSERVFIEVPTTPSKTKLPNGQVAHTIVKPKGWWQRKIKETFGFVRFLGANRRRDVTFATWRTKPRKFSLSGKRVAIVGRAASMKGSNQGQLIDSHDVVVRINEYFGGKSEDFGSRTDVSFICRTCNRRVQGAKSLIIRIPVGLRDRLAKKFHKLNPRYLPFTGTAAVFWAFELGASEVFVTGMDLYNGPPRGRKGGQLRIRGGKNSHDPNLDRSLLRDLKAEKGDALVLDEKLEGVLESVGSVKHFKGLKPVGGPARSKRKLTEVSRK
jgi:hypothetical protein